MAGRGFGKTRAGAEWMRMQAESGHVQRMALVAGTMADAREVMVEGESGILAVSPPWFRPVFEPSRRRLVWPNGVVAYLYSADQPDQLRGPQHEAAWADEIAKWSSAEAWHNLLLGLRVGKKPRCVATTTPQPKAWIKALMKEETTRISQGSTYDNAGHLASSFLQQIAARFAKSKLGRQEIEGIFLDDYPDALWQRPLIDTLRVSKAPPMKRIIVAVDPAMSHKESADETGIIVAGKGEDDHYYILLDLSCKAKPDVWARKAIQAYHDWQADALVAEVNQGGDLVEQMIRLLDSSISYRAVHASRGKYVRAEPVAALYNQQLVHHVGQWAVLEDQLCAFVDGQARGSSPDRADALVWALTELALKHRPRASSVEFTF